MDSNHRFPVRIKHKDGARRRGSAYPAHGRQLGALAERGIRTLLPVKVGTSAELLRHVRSRSERALLQLLSVFCVEVRLLLENRTRVAANARTGVDCLARPQADQAASSRVHSASLVQPARIRYWASSADISMVPSGLTLMCRPEKVCTDPIPEGACRRTRYRSGFSGF